MQPYVRDENLKRYRKALSEAQTIEHRVIFSALIANLECFEPVVRVAELPHQEDNFQKVA